MNPRLSICIPTYNRAGFLEEAVESIVCQINDDNREAVEVVISDNSSNDDTARAFQIIKAANKVNINYYKNNSNVGADRNILLVVERARGQYCWLLGDDDLVVSGAIDKVLGQINADQEVDVFMGDKEDFYVQIANKMRPGQILNLKQERIFDFKHLPILDYFNVSNKMIGFFNYISVLIFKKDSWMNVQGKEIFVASDYNHMYIFMSLLFGGKRGALKYFPERIVMRRWGTDRIPDVEARVRSDVNWVHAIAKKVFSEQRYVRRINNLLIKNDGFSSAVRAKIVEEKIFYFRIFPFLFGHFWSYPFFWLKIVPLFFVPNFILRIMRNSYRKLVKGEPLSLREMLDRKI